MFHPNFVHREDVASESVKLSVLCTHMFNFNCTLMLKLNEIGWLNHIARIHCFFRYYVFNLKFIKKLFKGMKFSILYPYMRRNKHYHWKSSTITYNPHTTDFLGYEVLDQKFFKTAAKDIQFFVLFISTNQWILPLKIIESNVLYYIV